MKIRLAAAITGIFLLSTHSVKTALETLEKDVPDSYDKSAQAGQNIVHSDTESRTNLRTRSY